jgi:hypothetical protein
MAKKPIVTNKPPILDINSPDFDDPDMPFTGGSSAAFVNDELNKPAEKVKEDAKRQRNELLPVAADILQFIQSEKTAIADIRAYMKELGSKPSAAKISEEYRARELYIGYLGRFEQWMINRLSKTTAKR